MARRLSLFLLLLGAAFFCAGNGLPTRAKHVQPTGAFDPKIERAFVIGMTCYAARDYRSAEAVFRRILDRDPQLLRVRLELARTLFMEREDEQADYHFRLAAGEHPSRAVMQNILRFREAIRARRAWRFNFELGAAPDSNINSATDKQSVDVYGLPFRINPNGRAQSGVGYFIGADASVRLNRDGKLPLYLAMYGRWLRFRAHRFDDSYGGAEAGPEFLLAGGRLRTLATGLGRWHGDRPLLTSLGGRVDYDRLVGSSWTMAGSLLFRHNNYAGRRDLDGWDVRAAISANRPIGPTALGFVSAGVERDWANDRGQAFWREQLELGILKEIGLGLRPQLSLSLGRQLNDGPLAPFGKTRGDWLLEGSLSIYKRDWNIAGFAPSLSLSATRNLSTLTLYDEKRVRAEFRLTKAF
jgi:hypothetical protein